MTMAAVAELGRLAQMQWGLVTTRQAADAGVSRLQLSRMAAAGVLERIAQGVYRMTGAPAQEHEEILAAWLSVSDSGRTGDAEQVIVGGAAAARLHGLGDLWVDAVDLVGERRRTSRNPRVRTRAGFSVLSAHANSGRSYGKPTVVPESAVKVSSSRWRGLRVWNPSAR